MTNLNVNAVTVSGTVMILTALLLLILWLRYGRDKKPVITVEFRPPDDLDPMEMDYSIGYLISDRSYFAMVLWWASKGYVEIYDTKNSAGAKRMKPLPDNAPKHEKNLFETLFEDGDYISFASMPGKLDEEWEEMVDIMVEEHSDIYDDNADVAWFASWILFPASVVVALGMVLDLSFVIRWGAAILIGCAIFAGLICAINGTDGFRTKREVSDLLVGTTLMLAGACASAYLLHQYFGDLRYGSVFMICFIISSICSVFMTKRRNSEQYGRILGFKSFIKTAEVNKLRELSDLDHQYGLEILPYAVLFGMGTSWTRKFQNEPLMYDKDTFVEELEQILQTEEKRKRARD